MKSTIVCLFAVVALAMAETYTNKYDGINYVEILKNDRLLNGYINCILDKGPCTPEGKELKSHLQEAIENGCAKCTPKQKEGTEDVLSYLINNKPEIWQQLTAKFDPTGKYVKKYEKDLKKIKN